MRFFILFLLGFSYFSYGFDQDITEEDRKNIREMSEILYGIFPSDMEKMIEEAQFEITEKSYDKSANSYGFLAQKDQAHLNIQFHSCEIEHSPTYCAAAKIELRHQKVIFEDQKKELQSIFWSYDQKEDQGKTIFSTIIYFSDTTEIHIQNQVNMIFYFISALENL